MTTTMPTQQSIHITTQWHILTCGYACPALAAHKEALAEADRLTGNLAAEVRAARLHDAVCQPCPAPHEHAARIARQIGL